MSTRAACLRFREDATGASGLEYAVVLSLVVTLAGGGLLLVGRGIVGSFDTATGRSAATATTPGGTSSAGASYVAATFNGKPSKDVFALDGQGWVQKDGALFGGGPGEHRALARHEPVDDCTISVEAELLKGGGFGIVFRASGKKLNGYTFHYAADKQGGQFVIRKWINGFQIRPAVARTPAASPLHKVKKPHHVELTVTKDTFVARVDGETVLKASDATYTKGTTGLTVPGKGLVRFDNFIVAPVAK